jgi:hypothetical protein
MASAMRFLKPEAMRVMSRISVLTDSIRALDRPWSRLAGSRVGVGGSGRVRRTRRTSGGPGQPGCQGRFDWAGIAITNRLVARVAVRPWLTAASDYEIGAASRQSGSALYPGRTIGWDAELGAAMRLHGVAVHEESVLAALLVQLGSRTD